MHYINYSLYILALTYLANGVKVNMEGTIHMGKDILGVLGMYLGKYNVDYRRSAQHSKETDSLYLLTKFSYICRDVRFCEGDLETFLNEYITLLTKSVETAFKSLENENLEETTKDIHEFQNSLTQLLRNIRKLLIATDAVATEKSQHFFWADIIKRICAMFQESAMEYSKEKLGGDSIAEITQKIIVATATVENIYEHKLCQDHNICQASFECTKSLNNLHNILKSLAIDKVRSFVKEFSIVLLDTNFYSHFSQQLVNHIQVILDEVAHSNGGYSEPKTVENLINKSHSIVEARLSAKERTQNQRVSEKHEYLVQLILSDMDHIYDIKKIDPFHGFLSGVNDWIKVDKDIKTPIRVMIDDVSDQLREAPEILQMKLLRQIRVLLEISADSFRTDL